LEKTVDEPILYAYRAWFRTFGETDCEGIRADLAKRRDLEPDSAYVWRDEAWPEAPS
jgi:hypothetical protein